MDVRFGDQPVDAPGVVIVNASEKIGNDRTRFDFANVVRQRFAFLADYGFHETESLPTIVRYRRGDLDLNVYHGRQSYEIGLQVGHADEQFSMSELVRAADPEAAERYRNAAATTPAALASGLERLAELVVRYGDRALRDDPGFFADLRRQRQFWAETYALDVLAAQTRPKAEAAFRDGRYREAAELYERIAARLSPAEKAKLAAARKRS